MSKPSQSDSPSNSHNTFNKSSARDLDDLGFPDQEQQKEYPTHNQKNIAFLETDSYPSMDLSQIPIPKNYSKFKIYLNKQKEAEELKPQMILFNSTITKADEEEPKILKKKESNLSNILQKNKNVVQPIGFGNEDKSTQNYMVEGLKVTLPDLFKDEIDSSDSEIEEQEFDPDKCPADVQMAILHEKATAVGYTQQVNKDECKENEFCRCCGLYINKKPIPICCDNDDFIHLKSGYNLYFYYIKWVTYLCLISFGILGIFQTGSFIQGEVCDTNAGKTGIKIQRCGSYLNRYIQAGNTDYSEVSHNEKLLTLILFFVLYFAQFRLLYKIEHTNFKVDDVASSVTEYALMLKDLPKKDRPEEIKSYLEQYGLGNKKIQIKDVNCGYYLDKYILLIEKRKSHQKKLANFKKSGNQEKIDEEENILKTITTDITNFKDNLLKGTGDFEFTGIAFVVFNTKQDRNQFLYEWSGNLIRVFIHKYIPCWRCCFKKRSIRKYKGQILSVEKAPEPDDILWENLGYGKCYKYGATLINLLISICILCLSIFIIVRIKNHQIDDKRRNIFDKIDPISFKIPLWELVYNMAFLSLAIGVINLIIVEFGTFITRFEKYISLTKYTKSCAWRVAVVEFMNNTITIIIANWQTIYKLNLGKVDEGLDAEESELKYIMWEDGGMADMVLTIMLCNIFTHSIIYLFYPMHFIKWFKKKLVNRYPHRYTQIEANKIYEGLQPDMPSWYSNGFKGVATAFFFLPILPYGMILASIEMFVQYWTDKYNILRRYANPIVEGTELTVFLVRKFELIIFFFVLGQCLWDYILRGALSVYSIIMLSVIFISWLFKLAKIFQYVFIKLERRKAKDPRIKLEVSIEKTYDVAQKDFVMEFNRSNPITHSEAIKQWLEFMVSIRINDILAQNNVSENFMNNNRFMSNFRKLSAKNTCEYDEDIKENKEDLDNSITASREKLKNEQSMGVNSLYLEKPRLRRKRSTLDPMTAGHANRGMDRSSVYNLFDLKDLLKDTHGNDFQRTGDAFQDSFGIAEKNSYAVHKSRSNSQADNKDLKKRISNLLDENIIEFFKNCSNGEEIGMQVINEEDESDQTSQFHKCVDNDSGIEVKTIAKRKTNYIQNQQDKPGVQCNTAKIIKPTNAENNYKEFDFEEEYDFEEIKEEKNDISVISKVSEMKQLTSDRTKTHGQVIIPDTQIIERSELDDDYEKKILDISIDNKFDFKDIETQSISKNNQISEQKKVSLHEFSPKNVSQGDQGNQSGGDKGVGSGYGGKKKKNQAPMTLGQKLGNISEPTKNEQNSKNFDRGSREL